MDMYLISMYSDFPPLKMFHFVDDYEEHEDFVNHWNGFRCQIFSFCSFGYWGMGLQTGWLCASFSFLFSLGKVLIFLNIGSSFILISLADGGFSKHGNWTSTFAWNVQLSNRQYMLS